MRLLLFVTLIANVLTAWADDRNDPVFLPRAHSFAPGPGFGQLSVSLLVDVIGGGIVFGLGVQGYSKIETTRQAVRGAQARLLNLERELHSNLRIARIHEIRKLLVEIGPYSARIKTCEQQVANLTEELKILVGSRRDGENTEDQHYLEIEAANEVIQETLTQHRIQIGKAFGLLTAGGLLILQVGSRLWIWNYHDADPGLLPNYALAYRYGIKPVFRLVGIVDTVENLILGPDGKERRD